MSSGSTQPSAAADPVRPVEPSVPRPALSLSPSRANDFKTCPLLYRLRAIDRIPEPPSRAAVRGTLVHAVLERLFAAAPTDRTEQACLESVAPTWERLSADPALGALVTDEDRAAWLAGAASLVRSYFTLEDPSSFTPRACELAVTVELAGPDGAVPLKGFIDRVDVARTGEIRIVDYKSGRSPSEQWETGSLYQLKFYALMIYRLHGVVPTELKLLYLADSATLRYRPSLEELLAFERGVVALWAAISCAVATGDFPPRRSSACRWCSHQSSCPEFGGTPPPYVGVVNRSGEPG